MIPDLLIKNTHDSIINGVIDPSKKNYVFTLVSGSHFDVLATNEKTAWDILEAHGKQAVKVKVEPQIFHGMTINEIILEAKKRGLRNE